MKSILLQLLLSITCLLMGVVAHAQDAQTICQGTTATYTVDEADGPTGTAGSTYTWTVTEVGTATYSGTQQNLSTSGHSIQIAWDTSTPGTYTLSVLETTEEGSCEGDPVELTVVITATPNAGTLSAPTEICFGAENLVVETNGDEGGTWSSSDEDVLTVNNQGEITVVGEGDATITYTIPAGGGCPEDSSTIEITVSAVPTVTIESTELPLCEGNDGEFTIYGTAGDTVTYSITNGTQQTGTGTIGTDGTLVVTVQNATVPSISIIITEVYNENCSSTVDISASQAVTAQPSTGPIQFSVN